MTLTLKHTGLDEARELSGTHGVEIRQLDMNDRSESIALARQIRSEFSFDGLVNNAGILQRSSAYSASKAALLFCDPKSRKRPWPPRNSSFCRYSRLDRQRDYRRVIRGGRPDSLGRNGRPDDMAKVVAFLLGAEASFINGASIVADGGTPAWITS